MFTHEQITALSAKLSPSNVKPAKQFGPKGDYIEGWHAISEANRIFGFGAWSYSIKRMDCVAQGVRLIGNDKKEGHGVSYIAHVAVDVAGVFREDVGSGHGYDKDLGLAHESAIKEAVTDALKRALRTFGNPFGLALYDKTRENVGDDPPPPPLREAVTETPPSGVNADLWSTSYSRAESGTAAFTAWGQNDATISEKAIIAPYKADLWALAKAADAKAQEAA